MLTFWSGLLHRLHRALNPDAEERERRGVNMSLPIENLSARIESQGKGGLILTHLRGLKSTVAGGARFDPGFISWHKFGFPNKGYVGPIALLTYPYRS